jgi:hypothetical protein
MGKDQWGTEGVMKPRKKCGDDSCLACLLACLHICLHRCGEEE